MYLRLKNRSILIYWENTILYVILNRLIELTTKLILMLYYDKYHKYKYKISKYLSMYSIVYRTLQSMY